jgi:hypothetical protein
VHGFAFIQALSIHGSVICKDGCDSLISISLTSLVVKELEKLNFIIINIGISDRASIMFTQRGYLMDIKSIHFVVTCHLQPNQEPMYLFVEEGLPSIYLEGLSIKDD